MKNQLHAAGHRSSLTRTIATARLRAGLPVKRFFTRFNSLADVPAEDLEFLSQRLVIAREIGQGSQTAALHRAVRNEIRSREAAPND
jgi:hypothetical protein